MSASPERFLLVDMEGKVETRPIKGTRPRSPVEAIDEAAKDELIKSEKDAAEHVMIVDVLRNDISRVCLHGSVTVPALLDHERHADSTSSCLNYSRTATAGRKRHRLNSCMFPRWVRSQGRQRFRAMEVIAQLEPVTRGAYCGTLGYFSKTGAMDTSILIRTYVVKENQVYFSAGGGIVADSDPAAEYEETLVKARALIQAMQI